MDTQPRGKVITFEQIEAKLVALGRKRREMAKGLVPPTPQFACQRLLTAAGFLVDAAYARGDFGDQDRTAEDLQAKIQDLAEALQGRYEDWHYEATR